MVSVSEFCSCLQRRALNFLRNLCSFRSMVSQCLNFASCFQGPGFPYFILFSSVLFQFSFTVWLGVSCYWLCYFPQQFQLKIRILGKICVVLGHCGLSAWILLLFSEEGTKLPSKMGVMSRRVLPVCSNLCIFCPSMRARSRQPVKRYKKLLAEIFPRSQVKLQHETHFYPLYLKLLFREMYTNYSAFGSKLGWLGNYRAQMITPWKMNALWRCTGRFNAKCLWMSTNNFDLIYSLEVWYWYFVFHRL